MNNIPSPRPENDETHEAEIVRKGLTAPRITPEDIEKTVVAVDYYVFPGTMLTVACVTLRNGFTVTGESACASPANFDAEIGQRIALAAAKQKIWPSWAINCAACWQRKKSAQVLSGTHRLQQTDGLSGLVGVDN